MNKYYMTSQFGGRSPWIGWTMYIGVSLSSKYSNFHRNVLYICNIHLLPCQLFYYFRIDHQGESLVSVMIITHTRVLLNGTMILKRLWTTPLKVMLNNYWSCNNILSPTRLKCCWSKIIELCYGYECKCTSYD